MEEFINSHCYLLLKDVVTFLISLGFFSIAYKGLKTWKDQIKGVKMYEISYNLNYKIFKLREAIKRVRNPAIWPSENYKAIQYVKIKYPEKTLEEIKKDSNPYVYEMRWEKIKIASTEMNSYLLGAEVLWGTEILDLIKPLNNKITELNIALSQKFDPIQQTKANDKIFNIVYEGGEGAGKDTFSKEVDEAIQQISDYIKRKLS